MMNACAARALRRWRERVDEILEQRAIAAKAMGFMRNRAIAGAFNRCARGHG